MNINNCYICHPTNYRKGRKKDIKYIVIHYVGALGNAKENAIYYSKTPNIGASAHYYVGHASENGDTYQSVKDNDCAWHCGSETGKYYSDCRNDSSIGIEMCCHIQNNKWYFDDITVEKTIELTKELMAKYNIPVQNVIRHYDVTHKCCPAPFVDNNEWNKFKKRLVNDMPETKKIETGNDIVWELMNGKHKIEIAEVKRAVEAIDKSKTNPEFSSLYWILYKLVNGNE